MAASTNHASAFKVTDYLHPKYWGIWLGVGALKLLSWLPYKLKFKVGKILGKLIYVLALRRRKIALANIKIAFPEKTHQQQKSLLKSHFASLGIAIMEMALIWYGDHKKLHHNALKNDTVKFLGLENLQSAQNQGNGVLILTPHFTTLEMTGFFISFVTRYSTFYRPHNNPLMDHLITRGRSINGDTVQPVANNDTRKMLKLLRSGNSMTFLPDQRYRAKGSISVPFFNRECPSNPATAKIAKLTGCAVVPMFTRRIDDDQGVRYQVEFLPALDNFPSGDDYQDTLRLHKLYETAIYQAPEQYLWVHNRWDIKSLK